MGINDKPLQSSYMGSISWGTSNLKLAWNLLELAWNLLECMVSNALTHPIPEWRGRWRRGRRARRGATSPGAATGTLTTLIVYACLSWIMTVLDNWLNFWKNYEPSSRSSSFCLPVCSSSRAWKACHAWDIGEAKVVGLSLQGGPSGRGKPLVELNWGWSTILSGQ